MRIGFEWTVVASLDTTNALDGCKAFEPGYDVGASPSGISSVVLGRVEWQSHGCAKTREVKQGFFEKQIRTCVDVIPPPIGPDDAVTSGAISAVEGEYQKKIRECEVSANASAEEASFAGNPPILVLQK